MLTPELRLKTLYPRGPLKDLHIIDPLYPYTIPNSARRTGKTENSICAIIEWSIINPNPQWLCPFVSRTLDDARSTAWGRLLYEIPENIIHNINHSRLTITYINGNTLSLHSSEKKRAFQGRTIYRGVFDEFASYPAQFWPETRPCFMTTLKYGGGAIFPTTPPIVANWFTELYKNVLKGEVPLFRALTPVAAKDCSWVSQEEIEAARKTMDPRRFAAEYEGRIMSYEGIIYSDFSELQGNVSPVEYNPGLENCIFIDIGYNDPCAILWAQYDKTADTWYIISEYVKPGITPYKLGAILKDDKDALQSAGINANIPFNCYNATIYAGRDIEHKTMQGGGYSVRSQLEAAGVPKWAFRQQAGSRIFEGIQNVRSYILDANNTRRLIVDPSCHRVISDLQNYHYLIRDGVIFGEQPDPAPDNHKFSHTADALRYGIDGRTPARVKSSWSFGG